MATAAMTKQFYTINDLVEMGLGSRVTLWRLRKDGDLPFLRIGKRVLFPKAEIDAYVANRLVNGSQL